MTAFFDYPGGAALGRVVPKSRIYEQAGANSALKDLFAREVEQIVWRYKLAPETINLAATKAVSEIQIFTLALKTAKPDEDLLRAIDRAIPFPLLFELTFGGKRRVVAAYKRPSEADGAKWVTSAYYASDWTPDPVARSPLPVALDLAGLYEGMLGALLAGQRLEEDAACFGEAPQAGFLSAPLAPALPIAEQIARHEAISAGRRSVERITARLMREKQFHKRVAIHDELRAARGELVRLQGASAPFPPAKPTISTAPDSHQDIYDHE